MSYVRAAAATLALQYGTRCPYELADCLGFELYEYPFKHIRGLMLYKDERKIIAVKSTLPEHVKKAIILHEVGHDQLHPQNIGYFFIEEQTQYVSGRLEREADLFAATLLLDKPPHEGETFQEYSSRSGVPEKLVKVLWG